MDGWFMMVTFSCQLRHCLTLEKPVCCLPDLRCMTFILDCVFFFFWMFACNKPFFFFLLDINIVVNVAYNFTLTTCLLVRQTCTYSYFKNMLIITEAWKTKHVTRLASSWFRPPGFLLNLIITIPCLFQIKSINAKAFIALLTLYRHVFIQTCILFWIHLSPNMV